MSSSPTNPAVLPVAAVAGLDPASTAPASIPPAAGAGQITKSGVVEQRAYAPLCGDSTSLAGVEADADRQLIPDAQQQVTDDMTRPDDIPHDVLVLAEEAYQRAIVITTSDEPRDMVRMVARAILAERRRCTLVARRHAAGRISQSSSANMQGQKKEARDFQSMALSAGMVADDILKGAA